MKLWIGSILFILAIALYTAWLYQKQPVRTDQLNQALQSIVHAETVADRERALQNSLEMLAPFQEKVRASNGNFYLAQGDVYRHFQAYPWALLSYKRAQKLAPGNPEIAKRIEKTSAALNLKSDIGLLPSFSVPRRLQLFTLFALLAFSFASLAIWEPKKIWSISGYAFACASGLFLLSALYSRYVEAERATIIEGTLLEGTPLSPGIEVSVMDIDENGEKIKVMTQNGAQGYVLAEKLRLHY